jgi:RNA polymerase sigma-70 factor, ECF subfamily
MPSRQSTGEVGTDIALALEQYRRELTGFCYRMLGAGSEAEDAVQETMIRAWRSIDKFEGRSSLRAWLYRIATNAALDRLATDRRRRAALQGGEPPQVPDGDPAPDERVLRLDGRSRARIRAHVARLPRKQREAVWLRWVEGHDYATIAAKLGGSEASARANVYQGLKRLRRELFDLWEEEYGA